MATFFPTNSSLLLSSSRSRWRILALSLVLASEVALVASTNSINEVAASHHHHPYKSSSGIHNKLQNTVRGGSDSMETVDVDTAPSSDNPTRSSHASIVMVRFFLVRHGETVANDQGLVVGQWDSPLSQRGQQQAIALGRSDLIKSTIFWRKYCSDLGRTQETARLVLNSDDKEWILDARIREIAKGARQEYPKSWEYERAVEERQRYGKELPLLETSDDAWRRIADFLATVLEEANTEFGGSDTDTTSSPVTVNVLVVSHAGALRTLLQKMASHAHPALQHRDDPSRPPDDQKRLEVPNTSVTILEVTPKFDFWRQADGREEQIPSRRLGPNDAFFPRPDGTISTETTGDDNDDNDSRSRLDIIQRRYQEVWDTKVVEFMCTRHLDAAMETTNDE